MSSSASANDQFYFSDLTDQSKNRNHRDSSSPDDNWAESAWPDAFRPTNHSAYVDIPSEWTLDHGEAANLDDDQPWSSWPDTQKGQRGPEPWPDWVVTEAAAIDTELGILKTGKEADVFLVERAVPGDDDRCVVMAAKRYRTEEHRTFHRSTVYVEGRRTKRSRDSRAMAKKTAYGRQVAAGEWAHAEFPRCHSCGQPACPCRTRSRYLGPSC